MSGEIPEECKAIIEQVKEELCMVFITNPLAEITYPDMDDLKSKLQEMKDKGLIESFDDPLMDSDGINVKIKPVPMVDLIELKLSLEMVKK